MRGADKAAKKASGMSRQCEYCNIRGYCEEPMLKECYKSFVEGFKKGVKWTEKQLKDKKYA